MTARRVLTWAGIVVLWVAVIAMNVAWTKWLRS
jgi:hypothetical protein